MQSEETVANCLKVFRIAIEDDQYNQTIFNSFPNILNFMMFTLERWVGSSAVQGECISAIRYTIQDLNNNTMLRPDSVGSFLSHVSQNKKILNDPHMQELLKLFSKHASYS
jgi:hypothetical protein